MNVREDLKAYLDDELAAARRREVEEAIAADAELAKEARQMESLSVAIRSAIAQPEVRGMEATLKRVTARRAPLFSNRWAQIALGAAALLALVTVIPKLSAAKDDASATSATDDKAASFEARTTAIGSSPVKGDSSPGTPPSPALHSSVSDPTASSSEMSKTRADSQFGGTEAVPQAGSDTTTLRPLVVQTANLSLETKSVDDTVQTVRAAAKGYGGWVSNLQTSTPAGLSATATMSIRIPESRFNDTIKALHGLGTVLSESMTGEDVTSQVVDVEARVKTLRSEEEQYRVILGKTRKIGEVLEVRDRLGDVRQQIESLDQQRKQLRNESNYSTIALTLSEKAAVGKPPVASDWSEDTWVSAVNGLQAVSRFLGGLAIVLFVYSPLWLPVALLGWWLSRRNRR